MLFIHGSYRELDCSYIVEDDVQAGFLAANHLIGLGHSRIGGIFKIDDMQGHYRFQGFYKACYEGGLILPDDISIVSFDDSLLAAASEIKLTTVAHPKESLGKEAAKAIIGMIAGTNWHLKVKIQPELIIRGSTKNRKEGLINGQKIHHRSGFRNPIGKSCTG